jgi:hypothetical protein
MAWIKPTEAEVEAQRQVEQEIAAAFVSAMTNPWARQTATHVPDTPQPKEAD